MAMSTLEKVVLLTAFLTTGTLTSISGKMMLEVKAPYSADSDDEKKFNKPWFQVWAMFLGMALVGPMTLMHRAFKRSRGRDVQPLASGAPMGKVIMMVMGPALCDLIATFFQNVGLLFTSVSIWQMLRGSIAIFSAGQRYCYLGEAPKRYETVGVGLVTVGLIVVGYASVLMPDDTSSDSTTSNALLSVIGIVCVLIAQFVQAWQTVIEEKLLHSVEVDPYWIVFLEGAWGFLLTTVIFMPMAQFLPGDDGMGVHETVWPDEPYMMGHSNLLLILGVIYVLVILTYNVTGMIVCDETEATTRNVIDACRALCVWFCAVLIQWISPGSPGGEKLGIWSLFELAGFLILVIGLFVYYGMLGRSYFERTSPSMSQSLQPVTEDES